MPKLTHSINGLLKLKSYSAGSKNIAIQFKWLHKSLYAPNCTAGFALANKCQNICNRILALVLHTVPSFLFLARIDNYINLVVYLVDSALLRLLHHSFTDTNLVY